MIAQPVIGLGGYRGWLVLQRTETRQREAFENTPSLIRDIEYFRENFGKSNSAESLVNDRRLRAVALGAFGLADEIDKKGLIQKVLEGGTESEDALAFRLVDPRYEALAEAFGYGNLARGPSQPIEEFIEDIIARFKVREFDRAIGESDNDLRLALNFRREIGAISDPEESESTIWFRILGQRPLREVLGVALNIPTSVGQLDIDRQRQIFAEKAESALGLSNPALFNDAQSVDEILRRFFLFRQLNRGPNEQTPGFAALTLLQSSTLGAAGVQNLLFSQL